MFTQFFTNFRHPAFKFGSYLNTEDLSVSLITLLFSCCVHCGRLYLIPQDHQQRFTATMNRTRSEDEECLEHCLPTGAMDELDILDNHGKERRPGSPLTCFLDNLIISKNVHIVNDNAKGKCSKIGIASQHGSKKGSERWFPIANEGSTTDVMSTLEASLSSIGEQGPQQAIVASLSTLHDSAELNFSSGAPSSAAPSNCAIRTRSVAAPSIPQRRSSDDS